MLINYVSLQAETAAVEVGKEIVNRNIGMRCTNLQNNEHSNYTCNSLMLNVLWNFIEMQCEVLML